MCCTALMRLNQAKTVLFEVAHSLVNSVSVHVQYQDRPTTYNICIYAHLALSV